MKAIVRNSGRHIKAKKGITRFFLTLFSVCLLFTGGSCGNNDTQDENGGTPSKPSTSINQLEYELNEAQNGWIVNGIGTSKEKDLVIPEMYDELKVVEIAESAFEAVGSLTSVHISKNVERIGKNAFSNCNQLAKITVDEANDFFSSQNDILYDKGKTKLIAAPKMAEGEIKIPGTLGVIKNYAYGYLTNVSAFWVEEGITQIEDQAFANSTAIGYVVFPKSLTKIGNNVFTMCQALHSVYYRGTKDEWNRVKKDASMTTSVYYYSESEPEQDGNYWREVNGTPTAW